MVASVEGKTQGDPFSMLGYGIGILPLQAAIQPEEESQSQEAWDRTQFVAKSHSSSCDSKWNASVDPDPRRACP